MHNSGNPSNQKNLDLRPYVRTSVRPYVQGATFSMRGQLYRGHVNAIGARSARSVAT